MSIAKNIIEKCGGHQRTAEITGRSISVVYRWTYDKERGGTGGLIPSEAQQAIMAAASRGECDVRAEDFFPTYQPGAAE